jgi:DNA-directed RNA polymerase subunit M/transcription elongation factor TFIIS
MEKSNDTIIDEISILDKNKDDYASPIGNANIKYITENFDCINKKKILYLSKEVDRIDTIGKFAVILKNIEAAIKLEAGIFEFTLVYGLIKNYVNSIFPAIYNDKVYDICQNLDPTNAIQNHTLIDAINYGELDPQTVAFLRPHETHPDRWKTLIQKDKLREEKRRNIATTDIYKCYNCGGRKCTMFELQTRSADEPMTKIITCLDCYCVMKK